MRRMEPEDAPQRPRAAASAAPTDARLEAWLELRDELRLLGAQLETVKLMLRLQGKVH